MLRGGGEGDLKLLHLASSAVSKTKLRALEARCKRVRDDIDGMAHPWFVEFAGMPRSGKSSCISIIEHFLRRNGFSVLAPFEGARHAPQALRDDLVLYNTWTATYAIRQILEGVYFRSPGKYHFVLLDRGLFDATAWFHLLEARKTIAVADRRALNRVLRLDAWRKYVKLIFVFVVKPKTALARELEHKLSTKPGLVLEASFLKELRKAYAIATECYAEDFPLYKVQTDGLTEQQVAHGVIDEIFRAVENRT